MCKCLFCDKLVEKSYICNPCQDKIAASGRTWYVTFGMGNVSPDVPQLILKKKS